MVTWIESQCAQNKRGFFFFFQKKNLSSLLQFVQRLRLMVFWHLRGIFWTIPVLSTIYDLISNQNNVQRQQKTTKTIALHRFVVRHCSLR